MASLKDIEEVSAADEEIVDVVIYQRDEEPYRAADGTEATIGLRGRESKAYRDAETRFNRKLLKGRRRKLTPEELFQGRVEKASAAVARWHGWEDGETPLPCTPEHVRKVLAYPHILEQAEAAIEDHATFFSNASTS